MEKAHEQGIFVLVIGPKGTGKTTLVREFAKRQSMKLESINFSLRTRESHLVGSKSLSEGNIQFDEGILIKSMKEGNMLYLDEINAAEADVLLRLDEALDDRRQVVLKESGGEVITANKSWFVKLHLCIQMKFWMERHYHKDLDQSVHVSGRKLEHMEKIRKRRIK